MNSSSDDDDALDRLQDAVASEFAFHFYDKTLDKKSDGTLVDIESEFNYFISSPINKPSLRPDKIRENSAEEFKDIDGFTNEFKQHLYKKLTLRLEKDIEIEDGSSSCIEPSIENNEIDFHETVLLFSTSILNRNDTESELKPKKKAIDLKKMHLVKKRKLEEKLYQKGVENTVQKNGSSEADSSSDEDYARIVAVVVDGNFVLGNSAIPSDLLKSTTKVDVPKSKKKKKKSKIKSNIVESNGFFGDSNFALGQPVEKINGHDKFKDKLIEGQLPGMNGPAKDATRLKRRINREKKKLMRLQKEKKKNKRKPKGSDEIVKNITDRYFERDTR